MANDLQWSGAGDPGRRLGRTVEFHPTIGSTNDRAWELLGQGDEGTAVVADLQTAGRGRRGRSWSSPPGVNLMVSVGIRPSIAAADAWLLGAATALAVLGACRSALPRSVQDELALKWPNDLVDEGGRRVGRRPQRAVEGAGDRTRRIARARDARRRRRCRVRRGRARRR